MFQHNTCAWENAISTMREFQCSYLGDGAAATISSANSFTCFSCVSSIISGVDPQLCLPNDLAFLMGIISLENDDLLLRAGWASKDLFVARVECSDEDSSFVAGTRWHKDDLLFAMVVDCLEHARLVATGTTLLIAMVCDRFE